MERHFVSIAETVRAVDGVDFEGRAGEFVCLFGHSGSGKTTLLNLLAGLGQPTSGEIKVLGRDVSGLSMDAKIKLRRDTIGVVHQADLLIEEFTAAENVSLPLEARGLRTDEALRSASALLAQVGLAGYDARFPVEMSGGQRQRVGIARALSGGRRILLADEPTGSLDSGNARSIFELLAALADEGCLVVVASHDPMCREIASRSVEMLDGRLCA